MLKGVAQHSAAPLQLPDDLDNVSKTDVQGLALLIKGEFTSDTDALFRAGPEEHMDSIVASVAQRFKDGDASGRTQTQAFEAFLMRGAKAAFTITMRSFSKTQHLRGCTDLATLLAAHDVLMREALQSTAGSGMTTSGTDSAAGKAGSRTGPPPDASSLVTVPISSLVLGQVNHGVKIVCTLAAHAASAK